LHALLGQNLRACDLIAPVEVPAGWRERAAGAPFRLTAPLALSAAVELPFLDSDLVDWPGIDQSPWQGVGVLVDPFIAWLRRAAAVPRR
jgi:hypothetical protein